jgi:hypothetical protein
VKAAHFLPLFFLVPLTMEVSRTAFLGLFQRYVYIPFVQNNPSTRIDFLQFGSSLISFGFVPCLLFAGAYYAAKRKGLEQNVRSIVASLFIGGAIGSVLSFFPFLLVFYGLDLSGYLTPLSSEFGLGWNLGSVVINAADEGLLAVFIGITASYLVSYWRQRPLPGLTDEEHDAEGNASAALRNPQRQ